MVNVEIVLHDIRLHIYFGEIYALIGKNGAGKTTFLKTVIGLNKKPLRLNRTLGQEGCGVANV